MEAFAAALVGSKSPLMGYYRELAREEDRMKVQETAETIDIDELAREFALSQHDLIVQGVRAFVVDQLRLFRAELGARCAKFGVNSLGDLEKLITEGKVEEQDVLDDFQNVDYLAARIEHLESLLETL
jgi:hypothetical protein